MTSLAYIYNRFCTERNPLPTESQVTDLERRIKVAFPENYRRFLLEFNGGYFNEPILTPPDFEAPSDSLAFMCGIGASHEEAELGSEHLMSLFDDNDPPIIVPIGSTPSGSLLILTVEHEGYGEILYKKAWGDFYYLAENISEFFERLHEPFEGE